MVSAESYRCVYNTFSLQGKGGGKGGEEGLAYVFPALTVPHHTLHWPPLRRHAKNTVRTTGQATRSQTLVIQNLQNLQPKSSTHQPAVL